MWVSVLVPAASFPGQLLANAPEKAVGDDPSTSATSPVWETQMEFQTASFILVQLGLVAIWEVDQWMEDLLPLPFK